MASSGPRDEQEQLNMLASMATGYSLAVSDTGLVEEEPDWAALNEVDPSTASGQHENAAQLWHMRFMKVKAKGRMQMQVCCASQLCRAADRWKSEAPLACSVCSGNAFKGDVRQGRNLPSLLDSTMP